MADCPICDFPMVWSETHERHWCSVYGWHRRERFQGRNVMIGAHFDGCVRRVDFDRKGAA